MSSSPSPTTSTRAATISSRKERRSNSFPLLASLNPFRSKSAPEPSTTCEPFLVVPGIWSTDATAKVFGYVETDAQGRPRLARSQSVEPDKINTGLTPSGRSLLRGKSLLNRYREVHKDDGTDDFSNCTHRQMQEAWERARQQGEDEAKLERENSEERSRRRRMKTVSQDDELTERGANPRTGVVSPYVMSDGSADGADNDYIAKGYAKSPLSFTSRRTSSGRWQQIGGNWSFVENAVPSPTRLHPNGRPIRQISDKKVRDELLGQMPAADNVEPDNLSTEQIRRYQQSVEQAYILAGGSHAMLDPETLPTPRQASPAFGTECPSTPPNRLHKIRRKEVGSALIPEKSDDTVVIDGKQRSLSRRPPPVRIPSMDKQHVRIMSPSMAALGVPPRTPLDVEASFLGPHQQCSRTASAGLYQSIHPLSLQTNRQAPPHRPQFQDQKQSPPEASSAPRISSPTLNQFLPHLQLLHPSHFANPESPLYRRSAHLLPPSLLSGPQKRRLVEDAATITTTTISERKEQRSGMQRPEGKNTVARASHRNLEDHMECENSIRSEVPLIKIFEPCSPTTSIEDNENAKSSGYQRAPLYPSSPNLNGIQEAVAKASHHKNDQHHSSQSHAQSSQSHAQSSQSHAQSSQSRVQSSQSYAQSSQSHAQSSQHHVESSQYFAQSDMPRVISSEYTHLTRQVEDTSNTTVDPIHRILRYPGQPNQSGREKGSLRVSQHHGNRHSSRNHGAKASLTLKGCKIMRPSAALSETKINVSQQFPQLLCQANTTAVDGVIRAARAAMLGENQHQHQQQHDTHPRKRAGQIVSWNLNPNVRGAYGIVSDQGQQNPDANGTGITRVCDHRDQNTLAPGNGTAMNTTVRRKKLSVLTGPAANSDGGVSFAGNWADNDSDDTDTRSITTLSVNAEDLLSRRRSLRRGQDLAQWLVAIEGLTQPKAYLKHAEQSLWHMLFHVTLTLHHGSPAIKVLRSSGSEKAAGKVRLCAAKEVALAVAYVLVLLNVAMLLRKIVMAVLQIVYWVWHPFTALAAVIRWCLIT